MTRAEEMVLRLLRGSLVTEKKMNKKERFSASVWHDVLTIADHNAVLPLLYEELEPYQMQMSEEDRVFIQKKTLTCVRQYYYLNYLTSNVLQALNEGGVRAVVFKGISAASFYPHPAYRKSGDIDLYLLQETREDGSEVDLKAQIDRAEVILKQFGLFKDPEQTTTYHVVFQNEAGPGVELHTFLTEPFTSRKTNEAILKIQRSGILKERMLSSEGESFPSFDDTGMAFSLILHMLHHFMRSGFGLKFLADWVVFWNRHPKKEDPVRKEYRKLIRLSGIEEFSDTVTGICERYLGLKPVNGRKLTGKDELCEKLLADILRSGEFGRTDTSRTVALSGSGIGSYLKEFQHRTKLNFPKASKHPLLYPGLWAMTLVRFLNNNRKVRHTSLQSVLKRAGERGELSEEMHLFRDHGD